MKINQRDEVLKKITDIRGLNLDEIVAEAHPEEDLAGVMYGEFPATRIVALTGRMLDQLEVELGTDEFLVCPVLFTYEHGNHNLVSVLTEFHSMLDQRDLDEAVKRLRFLMGYEIACGFWDRGQRKLHAPEDTRLRELVADLETWTAQFQEKMTTLQEEENEMRKAVEARKSEVEEVANTVGNVRNNRNQIETLVREATDLKGQVQSVTESLKSELDDAKGQGNANKKQQKQVDDALALATEAREKLEGDAEFIEGKREEIVDLTGMAAGGALGGKFEDRCKTLSTASGWWLLGIGIAAIAAAGWIAVASIYFQPPAETNAWLALVWKLGLLLPAGFILGFVGQQYAKERALQEEYAFRSAVAITLNAFADQLDNSDDGSKRQKLIAETVEKLYALPKSLTEKHGGFLSKRDKALQESVEALVAMVEKMKKLSA